MRGTTPPSQKAAVRPIMIHGATGSCTFNVRPEDLTWAEPSRLAVQNTLGGAWVDSFGPGIAQITIAGTTGWGSQGGPDWLRQFELLHQVAFKKWHEMVEQRKDPEAVPLYFSDALDNRAVQVVPQSFSLKRSKARPLLMQYNITFLAVRDAGEPGRSARRAGGGNFGMGFANG